MTSLRARAVARCRDDSGQLTLLITGLTVVVLTLIIGALAVTSVQISRMRLLDAADSAALDATDDSAKLVYDRGLGTDLPLIGGLLRDLGGSVTVTVESRARAGVTPG